MIPLLTAAQMRAWEEAHMAAGYDTGLDLMERAGRGVVGKTLAHWPRLATAPQSAIILCGPGNNGGDGYVVARLLKARGWDVTVVQLVTDKPRTPDALANHDRWLKMGGTLVREVPEAEFDVCLDAVFGTGLTRALDGEVHRALASPGLLQALRVAIDIPSGLSSETGALVDEGSYPAFGLTVALGAPKPGHYLGTGPDLCGHLVTVPLDLRPDGLPDVTDETLVFRASPALEPGEDAVPAPPSIVRSRWRAHHKYRRGHALVVSGGPGRCGAARLAARAALRMGAGLVTIACPPEALAENAARLDAVMLRPVADADALSRLLEDERYDRVCIGPGLGTDAHARALVEAVLTVRRPTVLDADALTMWEDAPERLFEQLTERSVLTPHGGEFARLFPDLAESLSAGVVPKTGVTLEASRRAGATVLFKGRDTVVAERMSSEDAQTRVVLVAAAYESAAPQLATAGSGDVLSGLITGAIGNYRQPVTTAARVHLRCALEFGPGLIAEDLPEMVPRVLRKAEEAFRSPFPVLL
ncbi:MAG: NAD(P)H-hydrate dehydratase [Rubricella sp.]